VIDLETVSWEGLSPRAVWTVQRIALPIACGLSHREVADGLGESEGWVALRLRALREEMRGLGVVTLCDRCGVGIESGDLCDGCKAARKTVRQTTAA
jgi:hypothetical protein